MTRRQDDVGHGIDNTLPKVSHLAHGAVDGNWRFDEVGRQSVRAAQRTERIQAGMQIWVARYPLIFTHAHRFPDGLEVQFPPAVGGINAKLRMRIPVFDERLAPRGELARAEDQLRAEPAGKLIGSQPGTKDRQGIAGEMGARQRTLRGGHEVVNIGPQFFIPRRFGNGRPGLGVGGGDPQQRALLEFVAPEGGVTRQGAGQLRGVNPRGVH